MMKLYFTNHNFFLAQDLWPANYQILLIPLLNELNAP